VLFFFCWWFTTAVLFRKNVWYQNIQVIYGDLLSGSQNIRMFFHVPLGVGIKRAPPSDNLFVSAMDKIP
jgi:hypothetical protein